MIIFSSSRHSDNIYSSSAIKLVNRWVWREKRGRTFSTGRLKGCDVWCSSHAPSISFTKPEISSLWRNFRHWLHRMEILSFSYSCHWSHRIWSTWQPPIQVVTKISLKWRYFHISVSTTVLATWPILLRRKPGTSQKYTNLTPSTVFSLSWA